MAVDAGPDSFRLSKQRFFTPWRLACAATIVLSAMLFLRNITGLEIWDDPYLIGGSGIGGGRTLKGCFFSPFLGHYYRPLVSLSFFLDHKIGGGTPLYYHQTNIIIHVLTTCVLFGLLGAAFRNRLAALLGAMLFAIQPVQVSTVAWIGGRTDSLCALWVSLFAWALIAGIRAAGRKQLLLLGAALFAFLAAIFTKEQATAAVLLVPLAFVCFSEERGRLRVRKVVWTTLTFGTAVAAFMGLWAKFFPNPIRPEFYSVSEQLGMAGRTVTYYTLVLLMPTRRLLHTLTLDALQNAGWITIASGYAILAGLTWLFLRWRRSEPGAAWMLALSVIMLAPVCNLIPLPSLTVAPYRAGVAGIGAAAVLGWALSRWLQAARRRNWAPAASIAVAAYVVWLGVLTFWGVGQWKDQRTASQAFVRYDPQSIFGTLNLTSYYFSRYEGPPARAALEHMFTSLFGSPAWRHADTAMAAYRADPGIAFRLRTNAGCEVKPRAYLAYLYGRLGMARLMCSDHASARTAFVAGLAFDRTCATANVGLGALAFADKQYRTATRYLMIGKAGNPKDPNPYRELGEIYARQGRWKAVCEEYEPLINIMPEWGAVYTDLASAQLKIGKPGAAAITLQAALDRSVCERDDVRRRLLLVQQAQSRAERGVQEPAKTL